MHHQGMLLKQGSQFRTGRLGGIDQPDLLTIVNLHQGQLRPEGALTHEFGVQIERRCRRQSGAPGGDIVAVVTPEISHEVA